MKSILELSNCSIRILIGMVGRVGNFIICKRGFSGSGYFHMVCSFLYGSI